MDLEPREGIFLASNGFLEQRGFATLDKNSDKLTVGWREWLTLPGLGIPAIKAKIDTGARTSSLHAFMLETFRAGRRDMVRFGIHPLQNRKDIELFCIAEVADQRFVSDSGGHRELRYVIETPIRIGDLVWDIEITLTDRDTMRFRMLLGRNAMIGRLLVEPAGSYLTGYVLRRSYLKKDKKNLKKK